MKTNNKFFLYDSYVFAFKNTLANVRIFALTLLSFLAILVPFIIVITASLAKIGIPPIQQNILPLFLVNFFTSNFIPSLGIILLTIGLFLFFISWITIALVQISFAIHDNQNPKLAMIFPNITIIVKTWIGMAIYLIVGIIGLLCFVIPGIYWFIRSWFYFYAIVDGKGIMESFSTSFNLTNGKFWSIFAQCVMAIALGKVLTLFSLPIIVLSNIYLYRYLSKN